MTEPNVQSSPESFGANDTTYIHLLPDWDAATLGYQATEPFTPVDIAIGDDGYIFIADSANNKIVTVLKSGNVVNHQNLGSIAPINGPVGIDIDSKLNLLIVNGTNTVYVWNQYMNNSGAYAYLVGTANKPNLIFSSDSTQLIEAVIDSIYFGLLEVSDLVFSDGTDYIDSVLHIHPFYVDDDENSSFRDVTFGPSNDGTVFLTDNSNNRILKLNIASSGFVVLNTGFPIRTFKGISAGNIATYGSGAGTVDNPRGITADDEGNVYFTQLGGNFLVQKLKPQGDQYISAFTLYEDPIMDLNRFTAPYNVALGQENAIFVLDTGEGKVQKFLNRGIQAGKITDLGKTGLVEAVFNLPSEFI